ncbi:hypothetical protein KDH_08200 [Dictyobacter sp. S3.2.2.5]|uniref:ABC transporter permease n=1 Tax=Dictyobacter halimunensis TaxID=3026934 RepID=A0ABQ6FME6_9CHLR|nr:hypothetical protein KDH_08200 [Dictyobacter sp. S3.2.2.5]
MFLNVLHLELNKAYHRLLPWVSLSVVAFIVLGVSTALFLYNMLVPGTHNVSSLTWPGCFVFGLNYAIGSSAWNSYGTYALIIITGVIFAQEYSWGTIRLWLSKGIARSELFCAKGVLALCTALLIVGVCIVSVGLLSLFFSFQLQHSLQLDRLDVIQLLLAYIRTAYALLPYAALTLLLVVLSRSSMIAVGGAIAFSTIIEPLLRSMAPRLGQIFAHGVFFLPSGLASTLASQNYTLAHMQVEANALQPTQYQAILGVACYTLLFFLLALWKFRHQDMAK